MCWGRERPVSVADWNFAFAAHKKNKASWPCNIGLLDLVWASVPILFCFPFGVFLHLAVYLLAVSHAVPGGIVMVLILCPHSSRVPLPYGHPDVTICLNHPFCSCVNILIDLMSYVKDL